MPRPRSVGLIDIEYDSDLPAADRKVTVGSSFITLMRRRSARSFAPHRPIGHRLGGHGQSGVGFKYPLDVRKYRLANPHVRLVVDGIRFFRAADHNRIMSGEKVAMMSAEKILEVRLWRQ